ncbi:MAG: hypothetical protein GWP04_01765 [Gammaproteobacteria bacterium]|nr:hypothetical protein [Gammaproteobacteria bacterium]
MRASVGEERVVYEAVQYVEEEVDGLPTGVSLETPLGTFATEKEAIAAARAARDAYTDRPEYAWWIARRQGERVASWIADSRSGREFVVDLSKEQIVDLS